MDPLSIAASVAGLLALVGTVISKGYSVAGRIQKKVAVMTLVDEIARFSGVLVGVKTHLSTLDGNIVNIPFLDTDTLANTVGGCEEILQEASTLLDRIAGTGTIGFLVKGGNTQDRVEELVARLERYKSFFVLCLQLKSSEYSQGASQLVNEMLDTLKSIQSHQGLLHQQICEKKLEKTRNKIFKWLGPTTAAVHEDISIRGDPGSSTWLLHRDKFRRWISDGSSCFWLSGTQGSGKTVITSRVIEAIRNAHLNTGTVLAYHYCSFSDRSTITPERLIGALICHFIQSIESSLPADLVKLFERYQARSDDPSLEELQAVLKGCMHATPNTYLVIDGLDEIQDRCNILKVLASISSATDVFSCKIFVSSRPSQDIAVAFKSWKYSVRITPADIEPDMMAFTARGIAHLHLDELESETLAHELVTRADGMFLWVVCNMKQLSKVRTTVDIRTLKALPAGMANTFETRLEMLEDYDLALALEILRFVMYSHRELDLPELVEGLGVSASTFDLEQLRRNMLRSYSDVFEVCDCLVTQSPSTNRISLAHYSVYEFLSSPKLDGGRANKFFLAKPASSLKLLKSCITHLSMDDFNSTSFADSLTIALDTQAEDTAPQVFSDSHFLDYAATYWWCHLRDVAADDVNREWQLLRTFTTSQRRNFECWVRIARYLHDEYHYPAGARPIHVAALHGLDSLAKLLLKDEPGCGSSTTSDGRTPLHIAAENDQIGVLHILLEHFQATKSLKPLEEKDGKGRGALQIAVESGNAHAVKQLVGAGAEVDTRCEGRTPVSIAIENNWDELASLLSQKTDGNILMADGRSLLHLAAHSGNLAWATSLIQFHKRIIHVLDGFGYTVFFLYCLATFGLLYCCI